MNSAPLRMERSTCVSAAKFTTASQPSPAAVTAIESAMSPSWNSCATPSRLARLPEYVSLSSTTTSSPRAARSFTKWEPMNPAPPVTSTLIASEPSQARAQALSPMRQARRLRLRRAQDGVRRPRRRPVELGRRDALDAALDPGLLEDRLGELRPRAIAFGGDVVQPMGLQDDVACGPRQMARVRRRAALIVHDRYLVPLAAQPQHRQDEVVAPRREEPRGADDPAVPHLPLAVELRAPVDGQRARLVRLDVRLGLASVEHVVGGEVGDRRAECDDVPRPPDVDPPRALGVRLRAVDVGPGGGVEGEVGKGPEGRREAVPV